MSERREHCKRFGELDVNIIQTAIPGVLIIEPKIFGDARGFFLETFQANCYAASGMAQTFVQDNLSRSVKGTLRGLHFQQPRPQGKLVTVLRGAVRDVAVDVRAGSPTFGKYIAVDLDEDNRRQFWVPRGFAHGFVVRSDSADFFYKCDAFYSRRTSRFCVGTIRLLPSTGVSTRRCCRRAIAKARRCRYWRTCSRDRAGLMCILVFGSVSLVCVVRRRVCLNKIAPAGCAGAIAF